MTFEELNEVRNLKHKITQTTRRIKALEDCIKPAGVKFTRGYNYDDTGKLLGSFSCLDAMPKCKNPTSPTEILAVMLTDEKNSLTALQDRLEAAIPELTEKILQNFSDETDQTLLIYRYVACEYFRDIGFKMGYSEQHIYHLHNRIVKKLKSR